MSDHGDFDRRAALVDKYQPLIAAIVGAASADDVVQDLRLKLWRPHAAYDASRGASEETWVRALCRNAAIDHVRARKRERDLFDGGSEAIEAAEEQAAGSATGRVDGLPEDALLAPEPASDLGREIQDALPRLPARHAETLSRYLIAGSAKEAAATTGISCAAFEKRLTRAKHELREWRAAKKAA